MGNAPSIETMLLQWLVKVLQYKHCSIHHLFITPFRILGTTDVSLQEVVSKGKQNATKTLTGKNGDQLNVSCIISYYSYMLFQCQLNEAKGALGDVAPSCLCCYHESQHLPRSVEWFLGSISCWCTGSISLLVH